MKSTDILIIGAGASGLMCGRLLSKAGKKVEILEARNRIGGRIYTFPKEYFGYNAEAGAEFIHGKLPLTISLINEAKLTLLPVKGQMWDAREGSLKTNNEFIPYWDLLMEKLKGIKEDIPIAHFLDKNFPRENYSQLYDSVIGFVEGFDAADPSLASTIALRDEWLSENPKEEQFRIKEGYGALMKFLESEFLKNNGEILLNKEVKSISLFSQYVSVQISNGEIFKASKVILTVPVPLLNRINFNPPISGFQNVLSLIGYGNVIKFLFRFKNPWWLDVQGKNLSNAGFIFSGEKVPAWWTQYPEKHPVLTGWLGGPKSNLYDSYSSEQLIELALTSLSNIFKIEIDFLKKELVHSEVINWKNDPFAHGAYGYITTEIMKSKSTLLKPVNEQLYFAGEAFYEGKEMGTVEAALASGDKIAKKILCLT